MKLHEFPIAMEYSELIKHIEGKYNIRVRDYAGRYKDNGISDRSYLDFWHWIVKEYDVGIGSTFEIYLGQDEDGHDSPPNWVREILDIIKNEVKDSPAYDSEEYLTLYVTW